MILHHHHLTVTSVTYLTPGLIDTPNSSSVSASISILLGITRYFSKRVYSILSTQYRYHQYDLFWFCLLTFGYKSFSFSLLTFVSKAFGIFLFFKFLFETFWVFFRNFFTVSGYNYDIEEGIWEIYDKKRCLTLVQLLVYTSV